MLSMISNVASVFASCSAYQEAQPLLELNGWAETSLRLCVDEICSSVPMIMGLTDIDAILLHYPHEAGAALLAGEPTPALLAGMTNFRWPVIVASQYR